MASTRAAHTGQGQPGERRDLPGSRTLILYLDGSAFAKLFLTEPGSGEMRELWETGGPFATSCLAYAEVHSALVAAGRARRISERRRERAVAKLDETWEVVNTYEADEPLALLAGAIASRHGLRALDAVHLASALSIPVRDCVVVSWDTALREAAVTEGLAISPA